jgi:hypothetical protein
MRCLDLFIKHGSILPPSHDLCEYSVLRVLIFPLRTRLLLNIGPHNTSFAIPKPLKLTSLYNNHKGPADRMRIFTTVCQAIMIHGIAAQYQIYNLTTQGTNLSSTCVGVLNQAVNCDSAIEWAGRGRYEADDILQTVCTSACSTSLSTWLRRASGACTTRYVDPEGYSILPAYWVETVVENYNLLCLKNG